MKSLKGLTHEQIMAETDHFFKEDSFGDRAVVPHGSNGGPECFLLNEREFLLVNELEALENAPPGFDGAFALQARMLTHRGGESG